MSFFLLLNINYILKNVENQTVAGSVTYIVFFSFYQSQCGPATVWLHTFFKIPYFVFSTRKKWIQVWDNMRVSKYNDRNTILGWTIPLIKIKVWRLARPLQELHVLLLEPLLCYLGHVLGHCHAGIPIHDSFSMPWLTLMPWPWWHMAPSIVPLMRCSCPVPLAEKHPPKHNVSTSMFDGGDGVLEVIGSIPPPPPNMASWVDAK